MTASDVTNTGITSDTGSATTVNPAAANKLVVAVEPSAAAQAGVVFAQQPVVQIQDAYGNVRSDDTLMVTAARLAGGGVLQGTTSLVAVGGVVTYTDLAHLWATNITIQFTSGSLVAATSSVVTVSAGPFSRMLVLLPGEGSAPGTATGRSGTPSAVAGSSTAVRVYAADDYFNPVAGVTDTVGITCSDTEAVLPSAAALVDGTSTFDLTLKTAGSQTVTATDITDGTKTANTDPVTVSAGAFAKLQLLVPGETAAPGTPTGKTGAPTPQTAGTAFTITVNAVDDNWNVVSTNDTVHLASSDPNAVLAADAALSGGTGTFSVTLNTSGSWTVTASDVTNNGITPDTGSSVTVNAGAFTKLQLLVPGETAAPGSPTGKTGTPNAVTAGTAFSVTVNAVDANWNLVNTITHTVAITTSDGNATPPPNHALSSGTCDFSVTLKTAGSATVTATDVTDGTRTPSTSAAITVYPNPEPADWYPGDMHVHRSCGGSPVTVSSIYNTMVRQDLSVLTLLADMGNGEVQDPVTDLPLVTGQDDGVSTPGHIVHWDAEWHFDPTYTQYCSRVGLGRARCRPWAYECTKAVQRVHQAHLRLGACPRCHRGVCAPSVSERHLPDQPGLLHPA